MGHVGITVPGVTEPRGVTRAERLRASRRPHAGVLGLTCWLACAAWGVWPGLAQAGAEAVAESSGGQRLMLTPDEQAWLQAHPVVRVALDPDWPPVEFMDRHGRMRGLTIDYLELISDMTGIRFERVEGLAWPEAYARLKRWEIDITLCVSETEERRARLAFTRPYLNSPVVVLTRDDVSYVGALSELNGRRVAVVEGYAPSEWLARDYPGIDQVKVASVGEAFERLRRGEVFAAIDNMMVLNYYLTTTRVKGLRITGMTPYVYAQAIAVRKDWAPLVGILQKAVDAIPAETRDGLYKKWVPVRFGTPFNYRLLAHALLVTVLMLLGLAAWNRRLSREIKARLSAERRLAESESNYRHLFQEHSAAKLVIDAETGAIIDANRAASLFYGWRLDELTGMNIRQINTLPPDRVRQQMERALSDGGRFEFQHRLADGTLRDVEVLSSRVQWQGKACLHSIIHDITERKRAMLDRDRMMAAINQIEEGVVITDTAGVILFVNPGFEASSGQPRDALVGQRVDVLRDREPEQALYDNLWATITGGKQWRGRFKGRRPDGSRRISEASIAPVRDAAGRIVNFVSVERDITEHVAVYEQLMQAQKMESAGRLAGGIAHDFNNLLQVVLGHVELAEDEVGRDHPVSKDLRMIRLAANRSKELTRQLLTFARRQPIAPTVVELNEMVGGMIPMVRSLLGPAIELRWLPCREGCPVRIDAGQLRQLIFNLCSNARDAIQGAGTVTVETKATAVQAAPGDGASGHSLTPGGYAVLTVTDTGCGLTDSNRAHLFEPFYTTKKSGRGVGLGLASVYGIVKQNGGDIEVESEPGRGASFAILLPRHDQAGVAAVQQESRAVIEPGHGEWVLVVDDDPAILEMTEKILVKMGYRVCATCRPAQAIRLIEEGEHAFQLLVTDVVMPEINGKELADRIREIAPSMRVLFMSGYTANVIEIHDGLGEGTAFLQKPFSVTALASQVRQMLGKPA